MKGSNQAVRFGTLFSVLKPSFLEGLRAEQGGLLRVSICCTLAYG
jgi:hypothetical protein